MSTSAVSSASIYQELQTFYQNRQSDLKQLGSALKSGDLNGAQQAYTALAALGQGGPFANSEPFANSGRTQAFEAIGEALQSGDLSGARAAFAALTSRQGGSNSAQTAPSSVVNLASTQPSTTAAPGYLSSIYHQLQTYRQQRSTDLADLGKALQAGDTAGAQTAFNALTALGQTGPNQTGQVFSRTDRQQDFQAVGQALQSGDLAGAQAAFASLEGTFSKQSQQAQSAISAYNSGGVEIAINLVPPVVQPTINSQPPVATQPPIVAQPPTPVGPGPVGVPELVINLGNAANGTSTGSNPELTINLAQGASSTGGVPELIVNLGGASGTSASTGSTGSTGGSTPPEIVVNFGQSSNTSNQPEEIQINLGSGNSRAQVSIETTQGISVQA